MQISISDSALEYMLQSNMIQDYTDDGFVYREDSGWVPAGDVIEFYLGMEAFELEEAKRKVKEAEQTRCSAQEETEKTHS